MSDAAPQSATNHARWFPPYHFFVGPVLLVYFGYTIWVLTQSFAWPQLLAAVVAAALNVLFYCARAMPLAAQD